MSPTLNFDIPPILSFIVSSATLILIIIKLKQDPYKNRIDWFAKTDKRLSDIENLLAEESRKIEKFKLELVGKL